MSKKTSHGSPRQTEVVGRGPSGAKSAGTVGGVSSGPMAGRVTPKLHAPQPSKGAGNPKGRMSTDD